MRTFKAIIIDDEEHASWLLKANLLELFPEINVERIASNWRDALAMLREHVFDFIFLDIMMPGKSGLDLVRLLPDIQGHVIFVTAHDEFAFDAFRCFASGYILKPVDAAELFTLVNRLINKEKGKKEGCPVEEIIGIPSLKGVDYIKLRDIIYLQSENKCTRIILKDKALVSSYHLGKFREMLDTGIFFQTHRSFLVNLMAISRYLSNEGYVIMDGNFKVPVARSSKEMLLSQFYTLKKNRYGA